ncbi:hypothetical protein NECAME_16058 [Necator americanus]|uniref:S1 motif domain-containing protein n=1 Tax=Necator americanus TaxID=51031 RepID=W2TYH5_NECAM|nr:hypothetical protein NECAME_16058 [Necator americanus]ETN86898.1 hypothetical protein NECAME_16058 [Necator americanus]
MGVLDKEIDFPRGGAPIVPKSRAEKSGTSQKSHNEENQLFGVTKKRKSRGTAGTSSEVPAKKRIIEEKAAVWSKPISLDLLTEGVMGLGVVIEIHEDYVLMETADSCRVRLPATQVSKKFTDMLKQEKVSLESSFIIGQLVPFRVIQRSSQIEVKKRSLGGKKKTTSLPIDPLIFQGYSIGDRVKCTVIDVVPQTFLVCFSLPVTDDSKVPLVTAIAYKKYLNKPEEIESFYSIGSEHMCRIMNFRYADRCMIVSTRKDMLAQKVVSYKDVVPGELMDAKVTDIHPRGVQVSICETVKGFIPADHASDKAVALEKAFHVGSTVKCRVWFVNEEKKQAWLTARQSLVNYKGTLISSYDSKYEGAISVGIIVKVLPTGGALLQFFGTVRGLLAANEARKLGNELK